MTSLEPVKDPSTPLRRPTRPVSTAPGLDPAVPTRRPIFTVGNGILAVIMLTFGLYASGNLPQLDRAFDGLHSNLQSHNNAVVSTTMHFGPLLLIGLIVVLVVIFSVLRFLVRPPKISEDMDWHSKASAAPRAIRSDRVPAPRDPGEAESFIHPLHKQAQNRQAKMQQAVLSPRATPQPGGPVPENNDSQPSA